MPKSREVRKSSRGKPAVELTEAEWEIMSLQHGKNNDGQDGGERFSGNRENPQPSAFQILYK
jgi:hypothetical protein